MDLSGDLLMGTKQNTKLRYAAVCDVLCRVVDLISACWWWQRSKQNCTQSTTACTHTSHRRGKYYSVGEQKLVIKTRQPNSIYTCTLMQYICRKRHIYGLQRGLGQNPQKLGIFWEFLCNLLTVQLQKKGEQDVLLAPPIILLELPLPLPLVPTRITRALLVIYWNKNKKRSCCWEIADRTTVITAITMLCHLRAIFAICVNENKMVTWSTRHDFINKKNVEFFGGWGDMVGIGGCKL